MSGVRRIVPLTLGWIDLPESILVHGGSRDELRVPVPGVLLECDGGWVLLDTGFNTALIRDAALRARFHGWPGMRPVIGGPGEPLPQALDEAGLDVGDIHAVAVSHLHWDHAGGLRHIAGRAAVHIQRGEYDYGMQPGSEPESHGMFRIDYDDPRIDWRIASGDTAIAPGVTAVLTAGHTPGHQSFVVDLAEGGGYVFAFDAANVTQNCEQEVAVGGLINATPEDSVEQIRRLKRIAAERGYRLIPGHDPVAWPGLTRELAVLSRSVLPPVRPQAMVCLMGMQSDMAGFDPTVPHPARMQNYVLGGKDHFAADREAADKRLQVLPDWGIGARESRYFLGRAVRHLAAERGIRQFVDVGPGLPAVGATHEVAQVVAPESRVVYVDNDPMVIAHARALLTSAPAGAFSCVEADLGDPGRLLSEVAATGTLDFGQPVALLLVAVMHFIPQSADPAGIVRTLVDALVPGSYLVISHLTRDFDHERVSKSMKVGADVGIPVRSVTLDEFKGYFDGLDMIDPGAVLLSEWRRDIPGPPPLPTQINFYGGVAVKP